MCSVRSPFSNPRDDHCADFIAMMRILKCLTGRTGVEQRLCSGRCQSSTHAIFIAKGWQHMVRLLRPTRPALHCAALRDSRGLRRISFSVITGHDRSTTLIRDCTMTAQQFESVPVPGCLRRKGSFWRYLICVHSRAQRPSCAYESSPFFEPEVLVLDLRLRVDTHSAVDHVQAV